MYGNIYRNQRIWPHQNTRIEDLLEKLKSRRDKLTCIIQSQLWITKLSYYLIVILFNFHLFCLGEITILVAIQFM